MSYYEDAWEAPRGAGELENYDEAEEEEAEEEEKRQLAQEAEAEGKTRAIVKGFAAISSLARDNCWPLLDKPGAYLKWAALMRGLED